MTDSDLENLYKANVATSHFAGLRGVFDAGVAYGQALSTASTFDQSVNANAVTATADTPTITQP